MKKLLIVATMLFTTTTFAGTMGGNPGKWYADHDVKTIKALVSGTCKK